MYGGLLMIDSRTEVSCFWVRVAELLESSIWAAGFSSLYRGFYTFNWSDRGRERLQ
jgi:hypothetical protein